MTTALMYLAPENPGQEVPAISETPAPTNTINPNATAVPPIQYYTQSGDTLPSITGRFGVSADEIKSSETIPANGLINPGILLIIPVGLVDLKQ